MALFSICSLPVRHCGWNVHYFLRTLLGRQHCIMPWYLTGQNPLSFYWMLELTQHISTTISLLPFMMLRALGSYRECGCDK